MGVVVLFLTVKMRRALYLPAFLLFLGVLAAILWRGAAVNASRAVTLRGGAPALVIDAGHGGEDGGASSAAGTTEAELNLSIALQMRDVAALIGADALLTRETEEALGQGDTVRARKVSDIQKRVEIANSLPGAALISIHQNSLPSDRSVCGAQAFYGEAEGGEALALAVQAALNAAVNSRPKEAKPIGGGVYLMAHAQCPSVLVECGFLSNAEEAERLRDPAYQTRLAVTVLVSALASLSEK